LSTPWSTDLHEALAQLPSGLFLMTSVFDEDRAGIIVRSIQPCGDEPPRLCVAVRTGHRIEPLIRDSRCFALSWLDNSHRLVIRKFDPDARIEPGDPFDAIPVQSLKTGSPVLNASKLVFDCEVVRHFDLEADFELYIGQIVAARSIPAETDPAGNNRPDAR
jgi:flavin reductase (DIM6/NTAB) family NADH-FMN oxidoreductase RutF